MRLFRQFLDGVLRGSHCESDPGNGFLVGSAQLGGNRSASRFVATVCRRAQVLPA
jgi:hypothetical protein